MSTAGHDRIAGEPCDATAGVYPGQARGTIPLHCCSIDPRALGVKIRLLDETKGWTRFMELEPDDPMASVELQMVSMAAWVADREMGWHAGAPKGRRGGTP